MAIINGLNVFASGYDPQLEFMKSLTRENYTYEAKKVLTNFLESEGVIPTKEVIRSNFDNVIPDDWEKVHTIVEEILSSSTKEEIERLTTPILPRMYYKSKKWDKPIRVVVEADDESKQFKMKVFILKDCYYLAKEIEFCVLEGKSLAIDKSLCWYHIFTTLYGVWDKENKKFTKSLEYERGYFASICNLAEDLCDDEKRNEKDKEDTLDLVYEFMDLIVYMNHCIDIEIQKKNDYLEKDENTKHDEIKDSKTLSTVTNTGSNKSNDRGVITIGNINIHVGKKSGTKKTKVLHRKCLCWGVRGHKRYYKSGKVVYIKPYKKGIDRAKTEPEGKTYYLKGKKV